MIIRDNLKRIGRIFGGRSSLIGQAGFNCYVWKELEDVTNVSDFIN